MGMASPDETKKQCRLTDPGTGFHPSTSWVPSGLMGLLKYKYLPHGCWRSIPDIHSSPSAAVCFTDRKTEAVGSEALLTY